MTDAEREERLIAALEAQANSVSRLVRYLEAERDRKRAAKTPRLRRAPPAAPATITPLVRAAAERALRKRTFSG